MKDLIIKSTSLRVVRKVLGVVSILVAIAWLISHLNEIRIFDVIYFIVFMILGLSHLTDSFGQEKTFIKQNTDSLQIKWFNKFRKKIINDSEIESITLTKLEISINRREGKPFILSLDHFETGQRKEIYEFFIEYCSEKGIELIRRFDKLVVQG